MTMREVPCKSQTVVRFSQKECRTPIKDIYTFLVLKKAQKIVCANNFYFGATNLRMQGLFHLKMVIWKDETPSASAEYVHPITIAKLFSVL